MITGLPKSTQLSKVLSESSLAVIKGGGHYARPTEEFPEELPKELPEGLPNELAKQLPRGGVNKKARRAQARGQTIAMITGLPKSVQLSKVLSASNGDKNSPHAIDEGIPGPAEERPAQQGVVGINGDKNSPHAIDEGIPEICPVHRADE
eukprot:CAMPEP_0198230830 /NCGR_PEP_ID=MMETSP1445-20131203/114881_1 /TAXON_ID=36898 /ORGANISM="Pyramimonas sp., Strain CCMP2087" /LENGTH=149 /DNA_ID=CAMNT_0043911411 /DNA_START=86 /DNA_END=537 /DNA_ORIENTATION=+